jgi:hypothetical protein
LHRCQPCSDQTRASVVTCCVAGRPGGARAPVPPATRARLRRVLAAPRSGRIPISSAGVAVRSKRARAGDHGYAPVLQQ